MIHSADVPPSPVTLVSAFLLRERSKGPQSKWYNYIQSVPETYTTLLYLPDRFRSLLSHNLADRLRKIEDKVNRLTEFLLALSIEW